MSVVATLCQVVSNVFEAVDLVKTVSDIPRADSSLEKSGLIFHAAARSFALLCNTAVLGGKAFKVPSKKLVHIKNVETAFRGIYSLIASEMAMQKFMLDLQNEPESFSARHAVSFLEKVFCIPFSGLVQCSAEAEALQEKAYLELPPEQFSTTKRPIEEYNSDGRRSICGYKPLDREECLKNYAELSSFSNRAKIFEAAVQSGLLTTFTIGIEARYKKLAELLRARQQPLAPGEHARGPALLDRAVLAALQEPEVLAHPEVRAEQALPQEPLDLLGASSIPEALQDDVVLSANICPISREPIRHPVGDPNDRTIYERDYIYRVIDQSNRSPITRQPLTREQLIPRPDLQAAIDNRLRMYQEGFRAYILSHQNQQPQA